MPAPDPSRALVRPGTPNLLGREIKSAADVQAAYEAVAQAQVRTRSKGCTGTVAAECT